MDDSHQLLGEKSSPTLSCCCAHGLEVPRVLHGTRDSEDRTAPAAEEPAPEADSDFKEEDLDGSLSLLLMT